MNNHTHLIAHTTQLAHLAVDEPLRPVMLMYMSFVSGTPLLLTAAHFEGTLMFEVNVTVISEGPH